MQYDCIQLFLNKRKLIISYKELGYHVSINFNVIFLILLLSKYNTLLFDKSNEIVSYLLVFFALLFTYPTYLIIFVLSLIICLSGL